MPRDDDKSLGDQNTFNSENLDERDAGPESLGDEMTFAGGPGVGEPQSLGDEATFGGDTGSVDDAFDDDMEVVDLAARYTTEGMLGKGGMGEVLLATDTRLNRKVAIKRILGSAARSKTAVSRFLTEAQSIAALNHPNIVQIYDYGRAKEGPFLIMEFVEGSSLLDKCREGAVPLEEAIDLTCQLCDGLSKAHAANIVHRDIKPANVLLTEDGVPKLTDFGLAKDEAADTGMTMAGAVIGTLDFMPPEQRKDAALTDARSDLWSLAATLYQMVTGETPKVIRIKKVPAQLQDFIDKALEEAKEDRYQTANELRDALRGSLKSPELVVQAVALGAGECPECHTQNESSRKFCSECAESLRAKCLKCESEMAVWDKVCGECGGKQQELLESRLKDLQKQKERAEESRFQYDYDTCLEIAKEVVAIEDERLSQYKLWAEEFVTSTETEWKRQQVSALQHFNEAKKHREVFDYDSAIAAIELVPEALLTSEMKSYLNSLESDRSELTSLVSEIRASIQKRDLDQLLPKVDRALKLKADHADLNTLQQQLMTRKKKLDKKRDDAYFEAAVLLADGKARAALELVKRVQGELTISQQELHDHLKGIVSAEAELSSLLKEAKADGVIEPKEVVELLLKTVEYLRLNPNHESIKTLEQNLQQQLPSCSDAVLMNLPPEMISEVPVPILAKLPAQTLGRLPVQVLSKLPAQVLSTLPGDVLSKLPGDVLNKLPVQSLSEIPVSVLANLPAQTLGRLPLQVLSKLPTGVKSTLPSDVLTELVIHEKRKKRAENLSRLPGDVLAELPAQGAPNPGSVAAMSEITVKFGGLWMLVDCKFRVVINNSELGFGTIVKGGAVSGNVNTGINKLTIKGPMGRSYATNLKIIAGKSYTVTLIYSRTIGWFNNYEITYA
ncbi:protein kinase [bacterium]|nr:protein kinase [bacterium]